MATKYYGIKDNWTDDDVANVIEVASEDGSVSSVKVNGVEYGGGGGGDFTTAEMTVIDTTNNSNSLFMPIAVDTIDPPPFVVMPTGLDIEAYSEANSTVVYTVVLYKGYAKLSCNPELSIAISGDISGSNGTYVITGNSTITIS